MSTNTNAVLQLKYGIFTLIALTAAAGMPARAASQPAGREPLSDAQIIERVLAFDREEVQAADAAKGKLTNPVVWQLAQRMSVDHAAIDRDFESLSHGAASTPMEPSVDVPRLQRLTGDELQQYYVDAQVKIHEAMLAALDQQLIPSAKSEELRRRLVELRAVAAAHLRHAEYVQTLIAVQNPIEFSG